MNFANISKVYLLKCTKQGELKSKKLNGSSQIFFVFLKVACFLIIVPPVRGGGSNPEGQSLTLHYPNLTYQKLLSKYEDTRLSWAVYPTRSK